MSNERREDQIPHIACEDDLTCCAYCKESLFIHALKPQITFLQRRCGHAFRYHASCIDRYYVNVLRCTDSMQGVICPLCISNESRGFERWRISAPLHLPTRVDKEKQEEKDDWHCACLGDLCVTCRARTCNLEEATSDFSGLQRRLICLKRGDSFHTLDQPYPKCSLCDKILGRRYWFQSPCRSAMLYAHIHQEAIEWRPHLHVQFRPRNREAIRTLLTLARTRPLDAEIALRCERYLDACLWMLPEEILQYLYIYVGVASALCACETSDARYHMRCMRKLCAVVETTHLACGGTMSLAKSVTK